METAPGGPTLTTAQIEGRMLEALRTIRACAPALLAPGATSSVAGKATPVARITLDDHDERENDIPRQDRLVSLSHEVTATLNGWARVVVEEQDLTHHLPLGSDTIGLCDLLTRWARWFSGHEAATDCLDELRSAAGRMQAAVLPQRREWIPLGTCPLEVQQVIGDLESGATYTRGVAVCGGQVRAYPRRDPVCSRCGTEAVASWWERVMFPDVELSEMVTADELVLVLHRAFGGSPVKPSTLRQWIKRGVIVASGKDDKGRTLYDRGAVVYAVAKRMQSG